MVAKAKNILRCAVLFALLLLPICYALGVATELEYSCLKKIAYLSAIIVLLLLPALFLKARAYFIAEGIFNFFFFPIEIASLYLNRQSVSAPFLQNILHTNMGEAAELLASLWPFCVGVVGLWILYFVLAIRVENTDLLGSRVRKGLMGTVLLLLIGGVLSMTLLLKRFHPERSTSEALKEAVGLAELKLYKMYPYNLYVHTFHLMQKQHRVNRLREKVEAFTFDIQPVEKSSDELYILVIGEASRYDHWGINGYDRNTTPLLANCPNLISYEKVFAQANLTEYSVSFLLTRATAGNPEIARMEKSLPEACREAGFWSGYISTQISYDFTERIRQNCNYSRFYTKNFDQDGNYDAKMVEDVAATIGDTLQFYLLHSLGSHFRYEHRYPDDFAYFEPVLGKSAGYSMLKKENKNMMINAYDNSIRYTDFFLHNLINYVDSLDRIAVIMYISDHGESFWDDSRQLSLHGSYQVSEAEYHVPLLIWCSDEYAAKYPAKVSAMKANKTTSVCSDVVFHSMLDIAGISDIVDSTRSICSYALAPRDTILVCTGSGAVEKMVIR